MRTLLVFLLLPVWLPVFAQTASKSNPDTKSPATSADALMNEWVKSWNKDETAVIENTFDPEALVLLGDDKPLKGKTLIGKEFVCAELPIVSNLVVKPLDSGLSGDIAYQTGSYTHRIDKPGGNQKPYTQTGRYTFVWKKQAAGSFKLKSVLIDSAPAQ